MFSLLHICSYIAAVVAFLFVTLSLASGLLYVAELVEEHSRLAKLIGQRTIYTVIVLHVLFCAFDGLPWHLTIFGVVCHLVYLQNFSKTWPFISLTSAKFIASCLLVILDHFAWFFYFAERAKHAASPIARHSRQPGYRPGSPSWDARYGGGNSAYAKYAGLRELSFMDVATFFGVCVWLVPFFLFLSLSANDNVLPSLGEQAPAIKTTAASDTGSPNPNLRIQPPSAFGSPSAAPSQRSSILKVALDPLLSLIPRIGSAAKYRSSRSQRDGLIASPRSSAPPSPSMYGPPSPVAGYATSPFSPPGSSASAGGYGYDSATLSPQTPYNNRFANSQNYLNSTPPTMLRQPPPGPKRSLTSPAMAPGLQHSATSQGLPSVPHTQAQANGSPPRSAGGAASLSVASASSGSASAMMANGNQEEYGAGIARSVSPFGASNTSGLVSRRKGA